MNEDLANQLEAADGHIERADEILSEAASEVAEIMDDQREIYIGVEVAEGKIELRYDHRGTILKLNDELPNGFVAFENQEGRVVVRRISDIVDGLDASDLESLESDPDDETLQEVKNVIRSMSAQFQYGVPVQTAKDSLQSTGADEEVVEEVFEMLRREGEIYEPQQGHVRVT